MVTLFVTSLSSGDGKTAVCAGIGRYLADQGKKTGYVRPIIGPGSDADGRFMKEVLSLTEPVEAICPSFTSESEFAAGFKRAFEAIAGGKDAVIIEGATSAFPRSVPCHAILVVGYDELQDAAVAPTYVSFGQQAAGIVVNKVPVSQLARVKAEAEASFMKSAINLLGVLPEDRALLTFSIDELVKLIDGKVANNPEQTVELAANFMLGAMTVDSSLPYYSRLDNKVAVIRSERPDMQLGAIQTSTRAVVVTGDKPLVPLVLNRAEEKQVPLITTSLDVDTVASRIEEAVLKTRFRQRSKMPRLTEIMAQGFNFGLLSRLAGM